MKSNAGVFSRVGAALLTGSAVSLLAGCGDVDVFSLDPGHVEPGSVQVDDACFSGSAIQLIRYSSECEKASKSLTSEVYDGVVFTGEEVGTLESPCMDAPAPVIDVYFVLDSHSIVFDFSRVAQGDSFPATDFEGYMLDIVLGESNGHLLAVTVDQAFSTVNLDRRHLHWDPSHIEVNFEGLQYDEETFLKLDLLFEVVPIDPEDAEL